MKPSQQICTLWILAYITSVMTSQDCNNWTSWMTSNMRTLKDKRLSEMYIPGTHASGSYYLTTHHYLPQIPHGGATNRDVTDDVMDTSITSHIGMWFGFRSCVLPWVVQHDGGLGQQLRAGYRYLQLGVVRHGGRYKLWEGGLVGKELVLALQEVKQFCRKHPQELILLGISCYTEDGAMLLQEIHRVLGTLLVPPTVGKDPTLGQALSTGGSVLVLLQTNACVQGDLMGYFWDDRGNGTILRDTQHTRAGMAGEERYKVWERILTGPAPHGSLRLLSLTPETGGDAGIACCMISQPCVLVCILISSFMIGIIISQFVANNKKKRYCRSKSWILPSSLKQKPYVSVILVIAVVAVAQMFFLSYFYPMCNRFRNFIELASYSNRYGASNLYCPDSNIYCQGYNEVIRHWVSRPGRFKPGILLVSGFQSSRVVELSVQANLGQVKREISVTYIGSPIEGTKDLRRFFSCPGIILAYVVVSRDEARVVTWSRITEGEVVRFQEGQFPMDSSLVLCVGTVWGVWLQLYSGNIHRFISKTQDLYIRGSETRAGKGIAYVSDKADVIGQSCRATIPRDILNATLWNEKTLQKKEYPPPHYLRTSPLV